MPITYEWYFEDRVLIAHYIGQVTQEELEERDDELIDILNNARVPLVHFLVDQTQRTGKINLNYYRNLKSPFHTRFGWWIVYGQTNPLMRVIGMMAAKALRLNFRYVESHEDAIKFLKSVDISLDGMSSRQTPQQRP
jgi:hypothetical protein